MGNELAIPVGKKIGVSTNPTLVNYPKFVKKDSIWQPYYINGLSIKVLSKAANGDIKVKVSFSDLTIDSDIRWAGNIVLPNITMDASTDLFLNSNCTLTINKSGTPNRESKNSFGDFINPTKLSCDKSSKVVMNSNSKIVLKDNSSFVLDSAATLEINTGAEFVVKSGASLQLKKDCNLVLKGSGRIEIESGAFICIETGAKINLQDHLSVINLRSGYQSGLSASATPSALCLSNPATFVVTGNGKINSQYSSDVYIQDTTYTGNMYVTGRNIFVGRAVTPSKPQGDVIINNGVEVIFDAANEVLLDKGFDVKAGGSFEIKK
jgi:hypothetical protein